MNRYAKVLASAGICLALVLGYSKVCNAEETPVTVIDIALEPDATMVHHADEVDPIIATAIGRS